MNENIDNVVALADICKVLQGKNVDKKKTNEKKHGLPVVVGASDLIQGRFVPSRWCYEKLNLPTLTEKGDILVSVVGTIGKMAVNTEGTAILSKHVCALRPKEGVHSMFLRKKNLKFFCCSFEKNVLLRMCIQQQMRMFSMSH